MTDRMPFVMPVDHAQVILQVLDEHAMPARISRPIRENMLAQIAAEQARRNQMQAEQEAAARAAAEQEAAAAVAEASAVAVAERQRQQEAEEDLAAVAPTTPDEPPLLAAPVSHPVADDVSAAQGEMNGHADAADGLGR